jgi:hypothetical protein
VDSLGRTPSKDFTISYYAPGSPTSGGNVNYNTSGFGSGHNCSFINQGHGYFKWRCQSGCASRKLFRTQAEVIQACKTHLKNHAKGHMDYGMNLRF